MVTMMMVIGDWIGVEVGDIWVILRFQLREDGQKIIGRSRNTVNTVDLEQNGTQA